MHCSKERFYSITRSARNKVVGETLTPSRNMPQCTADVRFGSLADIRHVLDCVRFTPERGHEWLRATPHTSCIFPSRSRFSISSGKGLGSLL